MGHVYLALDTRLGRHVALKFLPVELLSDEVMLQRLKHEARSASMLNHPNILTIYEVGEFEKEPFIASEFVDGVTLKKAIGRNAVNAEMAIRVATQIASALTAAHSAGVVHRDLKPANIMVRPDGYVKVIDFGLAKLTEGSALRSHKDPDFSTPGSVVGTVDYMSPEQARGDELDARTDLWSLGVILYEMLTRQRPFGGETDSHVIVAILDQPAPPPPDPALLPAGAAKIIQRALMKDPAKRYGSALEMLTDLEQVGPPSTRRRLLHSSLLRQQRRWRPGQVAGGFFCLLAACLAVWWWGFGGKDKILEPNWFRVDSVRQLTFNGHTQLSAISPDGKYLAFAVDDSGGMSSLHVKQVDQPSEEVRIPSRKVSYAGLTFSPDSRNIYEVEKEGDSLLGKLYTVPIVGERSRTALVEDIDGPVTFSPTGDRFAFVRYEQPTAGKSGPDRSVIEIAGVGGGTPTPLISTQDFTVFNQLVWNSREDGIEAVIDEPASANLQLTLFRFDKEKTETPLPKWNSVGQPWAAAGGKLVVISASSESEARARPQLREVAVASGKTHDLTKDLSGYNNVTMTADGEAIAATKLDSRAFAWISDENDPTRGRRNALEAQDETGSLDWVDSDRLVVNSRRTGYLNLALVGASDGNTVSLTNEPYSEQHASSAPAGRKVLLASNRSGGTHIWAYDLQSSQYTQLTFGSSFDDLPVVSPDGRWVVYASWLNTTPFIRRVPMEGGSPTTLGRDAASAPQISPDGKWIACQIRKDRSHWLVGIMPADGTGQARPITGVRVPFRWSPSGTALTTVITDSNGVSNLWEVALDGSAPRQVTRFDDESILAFAWSPSGKRVACVRQAQTSDVVLFKRQR